MADLTTAQWILGAACALLIGFSKTGIAGLGIVVAPLMTEVFPARESTAAMLLMLVVGDLFAMAYYRRHAVWRTLLALLPWVMPGIVLGYFTLKHTANEEFKPVLGGLILALAALQVIKSRGGDWMENRLPHAWWFVAGIGLVAGFATMLANAAGGIMSMFLLSRRMPRQEFMGTSAWFYLIVNLIKVPFSRDLGLANADTLSFAGLMIPAITAGALVGVRVLPLLPQKVFDRIILVVAVLASLRLIVQWP